MAIVLEHNFNEDDTKGKYRSFTSEEPEAEPIRKNFSRRELDEYASPERLFEFVKSVDKVKGKGETIKGYRVDRQLNSLGNPVWIFETYSVKDYEPSKNSNGHRKTLKNRTDD